MENILECKIMQCKWRSYNKDRNEKLYCTNVKDQILQCLTHAVVKHTSLSVCYLSDVEQFNFTGIKSWKFSGFTLKKNKLMTVNQCFFAL